MIELLYIVAFILMVALVIVPVWYFICTYVLSYYFLMKAFIDMYESIGGQNDKKRGS